jgi:hypothetical protein
VGTVFLLGRSFQQLLQQQRLLADRQLLQQQWRSGMLHSRLQQLFQRMLDLLCACFQQLFQQWLDLLCACFQQLFQQWLDDLLLRARQLFQQWLLACEQLFQRLVLGDSRSFGPSRLP